MTAHAPAEIPLSLAAEKAAQLHALLSMASDYAAAGTLERQPDDMQGRLLSLAAGLVNETLVSANWPRCIAEGRAARSTATAAKQKHRRHHV